MTNPQLEKYISYCKEKNIIISLVTAIDSKNYIEKIEKYIEAGLNEIMISLE
jgi:MoaA/NifB/PqqE/SkfB family radical SAM enzyme